MLDAELPLPSAVSCLTQIYFNGIFPAVVLAFAFSGSSHKWRIMMLEEVLIIFEVIVFGSISVLPLLENGFEDLGWGEYSWAGVMSLLPIFLMSLTFEKEKPIMFRIIFDLHLYFCLNEIFSWYTAKDDGTLVNYGFLATTHFYFTSIAIIRMIYLSILAVKDEMLASYYSSKVKAKKIEKQTQRTIFQANVANKNYIY